MADSVHTTNPSECNNRKSDTIVASEQNLMRSRPEDVAAFATFNLSELLHVCDALELANGLLNEISNRPGLQAGGAAWDYVLKIADDLAFRRSALVHHVHTRHLETGEDRDAFWLIMIRYAYEYDPEDFAEIVKRVSCLHPLGLQG